MQGARRAPITDVFGTPSDQPARALFSPRKLADELEKSQRSGRQRAPTEWLWQPTQLIGIES
jgi:hypothetical protein